MNNIEYIVIKENTSQNIQATNVNDKYVLEGIFTVFGKMNSNQRIYEEEMFLPHIDALQEKIKNKALYGELDHPESLQASLTKASHIVESLYYDKDNRCVRGRIKILDTPTGQIAKALINAGCQLSVSSRAAGIVENSKAIVKNLITYDLVADPGFPEAKLQLVNESLNYLGNGKLNTIPYIKNKNSKRLINDKFGIMNENIKIYNFSDKRDEFLQLLSENKIKKNKKMGDGVTIQQMEMYSKNVKDSFEQLEYKFKKLSESLNNKENSKVISLIEELNQKLSTIDKKINQNEKIISNLKNNMRVNENNTSGNNSKQINELKQSIKDIHNYLGNHICKHLNGVINYSNYNSQVNDFVLKHNNHLSEKLNDLYNFTDGHLREKVNELYNFTDGHLREKVNDLYNYIDNHLVEKINVAHNHNDYMAKKMNEMFNYSEYNSGKLNELYNYVDNHLGDKIEDLYEHNNYLADKTSDLYDNNGYITEKLNDLYNYTDGYLGEKVEDIYNGNMKPILRKDKSKNIASNKNTDIKNINERLNNLQNIIQKQKNNKEVDNLNFLNYLNEKQQVEYFKMDKLKKQRVCEKLKDVKLNESNVVNVINSVLNESKDSLWILNMPQKYVSYWNSLNEGNRNVLIKQSKSYKLDTQYQIDTFWETRNIDLSNVSSDGLINESKTNVSPEINVDKTTMNLGYNDEYIKRIGSYLKKR